MKQARVFLLAAVLAVTPAVSMAQIPVTDGAALGQRIMLTMQEVMKMVVQIEKATTQIERLKKEYDALTGETSIGDFVTGDIANLNSVLPDNWQDKFGAVMGGQAVAKIENLKQAIQEMSPGEALQYIEQRTNRKAAADHIMVQEAFSRQTERLATVQSLSQQVSTAKNMKEIADLQARISALQAAIAVERSRLASMAMLQDSQARLIRVQKEAAVEKYLYGNGSYDTADLSLDW